MEVEKMRFNTDDFLKEGNRFYVDKLKFIDMRNSLTYKYNVLRYIFPDNENNTTAFGWGEDNNVGIVSGNSFQFMISVDGVWVHNFNDIKSNHV